MKFKYVATQNDGQYMKNQYQHAGMHQDASYIDLNQSVLLIITTTIITVEHIW